jgi:hypothetical protein
MGISAEVPTPAGQADMVGSPGPPAIGCHLKSPLAAGKSLNPNKWLIFSTNLIHGDCLMLCVLSRKFVEKDWSSTPPTRGILWMDFSDASCNSTNMPQLPWTFRDSNIVYVSPEWTTTYKNSKAHAKNIHWCCGGWFNLFPMVTSLD